MLFTPQNNATLPVWQRRHPEWVEHNLSWRQRYDSWEGGDRYRNATYDYDEDGLIIYNLVRHKHEKPPVGQWDGGDILGADAAARAGEGDFQYRRARTPPPALVEYAVESHLSKIYAHEVERDGPAKLVAWWKNVDGMGSTIDDWMQSAVSPLLLVMGQLDLAFDRPVKPEGAKIRSIHDQEFYGLTGCVGSFVLPQNTVWWRLNRDGTYSEVLVKEPLDEGGHQWRHWDAEGSQVYDENGQPVGPKILHGFGRVPIVRAFDSRNPRCKNIGKSRYEAIVHLQREVYNRESELILSDTHQAFPLLQGPEDYCTPNAEIPLGPSFLLPMKKNVADGSATYQGFEAVNFPMEGAESIRKNVANLLDAVDRVALLTKPAGAAGTGGSTVAQSGISKRLDQEAGNDRLTKIAARLQACEMIIARMACMVMGIDDSNIKIVYPRSFQLATATELAQTIESIQQILAASGNAPTLETELIQRLARQAMPGLVDAQYKAIDEEIASVVKAKAAEPDPPTLIYTSQVPVPSSTPPAIEPPAAAANPADATPQAKPPAAVAKTKNVPKPKGKPPKA